MLRVVTTFVLMVIAILPAHAVVTDGFFDEEVRVEDQSSGERLKAFSQAMESVLQRLSGLPLEQAEDTRWQDIINNASRFVERYNYREEERESGFFLRVQFSARPLQALLMDRGLPVWPVNRQPVALWLVVSGGQRQLLHSGQRDDVVFRAVEKAAQNWGLPVHWPAEADVGHRDGVATSDVTAEFDERLLEASKNYGSGPVVGATLERQSGTWVFQWRWINVDGAVQSGRAAAAQREQAVADGVADLAQAIARVSVVVLDADAVKELHLDIEGVECLEDVAAIREQLSDWLVVQSVREIEVEPKRLMLKVVLQGGRSELLERLKNSGHFESLDEGGVSVNIAPRGEVTPAEEGGTEVMSPVVKLRWLGAR